MLIFKKFIANNAFFLISSIPLGVLIYFVKSIYSWPWPVKRIPIIVGALISCVCFIIFIIIGIMHQYLQNNNLNNKIDGLIEQNSQYQSTVNDLTEQNNQYQNSINDLENNNRGLILNTERVKDERHQLEQQNIMFLNIINMYILPSTENDTSKQIIEVLTKNIPTNQENM